MLSKIQLEKIINEYIAQGSFDDIHWKSQDSKERSILFYKIGNDNKSVEDFKKRIKSSKFGFLIVNRMMPELPLHSVVISEKFWPDIQKEILDILYPLPFLKMIAITGTNGKTTTTDLILQMGHLIGKKGISIGTLGVREYQKTILDFGLTSPSLIDLRKFLYLYGKGKDFCVLEASSHALIQNRLNGLVFDSAGWLSFSQDHLDYHKSMDEYFSAKIKLLDYLSESARLYIPNEQQSLFSKVSKISKKAVTAPEIKNELPIFFKTRFNQNNLEVAKAVIEDVFKTNFTNGFDQLQAPDGRFYIRNLKTNFIVVDFAHSPDALENICRSLKETFPNHKLKVLFGCGGDRDRTKRPLMGTVVDAWASEIYVTSDNPRSENPEQIIDDIMKGISKNKVHVIIERPLAVKTAFSELKENEVLLLAGKGHEDYILKNGVKHPYSDIKELDEFLAGKKI